MTHLKTPLLGNAIKDIVEILKHLNYHLSYLI
jgi:hypothetical protein